MTQPRAPLSIHQERLLRHLLADPARPMSGVTDDTVHGLLALIDALRLALRAAEAQANSAAKVFRISEKIAEKSEKSFVFSENSNSQTDPAA